MARRGKSFPSDCGTLRRAGCANWWMPARDCGAPPHLQSHRTACAQRQPNPIPCRQWHAYLAQTSRMKFDVLGLHDHLSRCKFRCYLVEGIKIAIECQCQSSLCPIHEKIGTQAKLFHHQGTSPGVLVYGKPPRSPGPAPISSHGLLISTVAGGAGGGRMTMVLVVVFPYFPISNQCWQQ